MDIESCATTVLEHHEHVSPMKNNSMEVELNIEINNDKSEIKNDNDDNDNNFNDKSMPKECKNLIDEQKINIENTENQKEIKENKEDSEKKILDNSKEIKEDEEEEEEIFTMEVLHNSGQSDLETSYNQESEIENISTEENEIFTEKIVNEFNSNKSPLSKDNSDEIYNEKEHDNIEEVEDLSMEEEEEEEENEESYSKNPDIDNEDDHENIVDDDDDDDDEKEDNEDEDEDEDDEDEDDDVEDDDDDDDDDDEESEVAADVENNVKEDNDVELIISSDEEEQQMNNRQEISKMKNFGKNYQHDNYYDDEDDSDDDNEVYDDNDVLMNEVFMFSKNEPKSIRNDQKLEKKIEGRTPQKNNWNFIIKEKKKSIKLLNNKKWLKKSNDYISKNNRSFSPLPSVSKLYNIETIKDDNHYDMNEKLSGHRKQLDNSNASNNKPLVSIEIEDSPEKESFNVNVMKQTVKEEKNISSCKIKMSFENDESQIKNSNDKNNESLNMCEKKNESIKQEEQSEEKIEIIINVNDDDINMKNIEENKIENNNTVENNILENQSKINNDCKQEEKNYDNNLENCEVIKGSKEVNKEKGKSELSEKENEKDAPEQSSINNAMDKDKSEKKTLLSHMQDQQLSGDSIPEINLKRTRSNSFTREDKSKLNEQNNDDGIHENELHPTKKLRSELQTNSSTLKLNQKNNEINENYKTQPPSSSSKKESQNELQSNSPTTSKLDQQNNENHDNDNNDNDNDELHPIKKLRSELQSNFPIHNKILNDYVGKITNDSVNEIQKHLQQTITEIQTLNDMIRQNEIEWENMLHLKKIKEEICYRLTRKKHQIEILSSKYEEIYENSETIAATNTIVDDSSIADNCSNNYIKQQQQQQIQQEKETINNNNNNNNNKITNNSLHMVTSTPNNTTNDDNLNTIEEGLLKKLKTGHMLNANSDDKSISSDNLNNGNYLSSSILNSSIGITKSILQSRANMKSSDLVKEKVNLQKFHRNILPKPSSSALIFGSRPTTDLNTLSSTTSISTPSHSVPISTYTQQTPEGNSITITANSGNFNLQQQFENNRKSINQQQQQQQRTILNTYLMETANVQQQVDELLNDYFNSQINRQYNQQQLQQHYTTTSNANQQPVMIGRQGVFKDVKSIIADYRQKHPESIPRRGRRLKGTNSNNALNQAIATEVNSILGNALKTEYGGNSRPSSNDSSHSINHIHGANINNTNLGNLQIKDIMAQFAKISGQNATIERGIKSLQATSSGNNPIQSIVTTPPYPEVTLHPVTTSQSNNNENQSGSLLHGILTKCGRTSAPTVTVSASSSTNINNNQASSSSYKSSFSPTLAKLLTAPERITSISSNSSAPISSSSIAGNLNSTGTVNTTSSATAAAIAAVTGLNFSKVVAQNSEITITPVTSSQSTLHQTLLQQQQQQQQQKQHAEFIQHKQQLELLAKGRNFSLLDDDADDSADRLVIDESGNNSAAVGECHRVAPHAFGQQFDENEVPACQGCKKQEAQFVCAGCGNQWYCSRECQVNAWDEHSEVCTG